MSRLEEICKRCEAATDGPWFAKATDDEHFMNARYVGTTPGPFEHNHQQGMSLGDEQISSDKVVAITLLQTPRLADNIACDENAEFIAHAREDIPWLTERVEELGVALRGILSLPTPPSVGGIVVKSPVIAKAIAALAKLEE